MAMELHLTTDKAQRALEAVTQRIAALESRVKGFDKSGANAVQAALSGIVGPPTSAITGIRDLSNALAKMNKATGLKEVADSLRAFQGVGNFNAVAQNITALSAALAGLKVPRGMAAFVNQVAKLGVEAGKAAPRVIALSRALGNVTAPGLNGVAAGIRAIGNQANNSVRGVSFLGNELRLLGGVGLGLGLRQTYQGLRQLFDVSTEAAAGMVAFSSKMQASGQTVVGVGKSYEWLREVTTRLAIPIDVGLQAFSKLSVSMAEVGHTAGDTQRVFEGFSVGFRAMGLTADQTNRAFNAVSQMFTKGTVTMEELRQQLGEVFPAFGLLAKSMGITTMELAKMMAQGQVASSVNLKLADDIKTKFTPALEFMGKTGVAALIRLKSGFYELSSFSGEALFRQMTDGVQALSAAMFDAPIQSFAAFLGGTLGAALGLAARGATFLAESLGYTVMIFSSVVNAGATLAGMFLGLFTSVSSVTSIFSGFGAVVGNLAAPITGFVIAVLALNTAFTLASVAAALFTRVGLTALVTSMLPVITTAGLIVTAFTAVYATLNGLYSFLSGNGFWAGFNAGLAEVGQGITVLAEKTRGLIDGGLQHIAPALDIAKQAAEGAAAGLSDYTSEIQAAADATNSATTAQSALGDSTFKTGADLAREAREAENLKLRMEGLATSAFDAADGNSSVGSSAQSAGSAAASATSGVNALSASYNNLAASAENAASSISKVKLTGRPTGSGGSEGYDNLDSYTTDFDFSSGGSSFDFGSGKGGGMAGALPGSQSASLSSFSGAPQLATGIANTNSLTPSLPGGGIPAILHSNEAVVPLPSGGAIPVQMDGGGSGEAMQLLKSINSTMGRLLDRFTKWTEETLRFARTASSSVTAASTGSSGSSSSSALSVAGMIGGIQTPFGQNGAGNLTTGGGGGGFSFGLGTGLQGGGTSAQAIDGQRLKDGSVISYDLMDQYQSLTDQLADVNRKWNDLYVRGFKWGTGNAPYTPTSPAMADQLAEYQVQRSRLVRDIATLISRNPTLAQFVKEMGGMNPAIGTPGHLGVGFATGSPNASKDMRGGGFNAVLHPNEAVIPLPDGRSVPVQLPPEMTRQMKAHAEGGGGAKVQNITMNITTPDAGSFMKSQNQIENEMRGRLARQQERSGPPPRLVEDPTRRTTKV